MAEKEGFEPSRQLSRPTPLAGEPLRPNLGTSPYEYVIGGERGIRTPGAFRHHWFSRPAPSTSRPSLQAQTSEIYYSRNDWACQWARVVFSLFDVNFLCRRAADRTHWATVRRCERNRDLLVGRLLCLPIPCICPFPKFILSSVVVMFQYVINDANCL